MDEGTCRRRRNLRERAGRASSSCGGRRFRQASIAAPPASIDHRQPSSPHRNPSPFAVNYKSILLMLQLPLLGARAVQASSSRAFATLPTSASTARSNLVRHLQQPRFRPASASSPLSSALAGRRFASSGWSQAPRASDFEAAGGWKKVGTVAAVFGGAGATFSSSRMSLLAHC